jgi:transaldolase
MSARGPRRRWCSPAWAAPVMVQQRNPLRELLRFGQSPWLDFIDRELLESGELERLIAAGSVRGITSNPAIFEQAIGATHAYDADIARLARAGHDALQIYETLAMADVRAAADAFRALYDDSDGADGFVSFEVSPHLAHDARGTIAAARRLWTVLDRPNVMIKVPGTPAGLTAVVALLAEGINVNVTLLFSVTRYQEVLQAHAAGLRNALGAGRPIGHIASVASFFLSRIDTAVDAELERRGATALALRGEAAVACGRSAYRTFDEFCREEPFRRLEARGGRRQRLLWASTGTKDPTYGDVKYVEPLIGAHTVNTMPLATLAAYRDHGSPARRLPDEVRLGSTTLAALAAAGVDLDRITTELLDAGITKFLAPYDTLLRKIEQRAAKWAPQLGMARQRPRRQER